jgi:uncharacterized protein (DUF1499 family)
MLVPCPDDASRCVSSQDDRPRCFVAPWEYDGPWTATRDKLVTYVLSLPGTRLVAGDRNAAATADEDTVGRYLRFEVVSGADTAGPANVDDLEFYFTPNDDIVQYRSLRREGSDFLGRENRARIEAIRRALKVRVFLLYLFFRFISCLTLWSDVVAPAAGQHRGAAQPCPRAVVHGVSFRQV